MTAEEYRGALVCCASAAQMVAMVDVPDLLQRIDRAETVGPIVDPTLYRDKAGAMAEDKELLEAALPLWRIAKKIEALAKKSEEGR